MSLHFNNIAPVIFIYFLCLIKITVTGFSLPRCRTGDCARRLCFEYLTGLRRRGQCLPLRGPCACVFTRVFVRACGFHVTAQYLCNYLYLSDKTLYINIKCVYSLDLTKSTFHQKNIMTALTARVKSCTFYLYLMQNRKERQV